MNKYINTTLDLQHSIDTQLVLELLTKWCRAKPDNKELQEVSKAFMNIIFYSNKITMERWAYEKYCSDAREERNRATLRARSANEEINKLKEQLKQVNYDL
tara:strand:- start:254 stop:556 length:303 start_codon:yes stop_codon:yes gene_type:complete